MTLKNVITAVLMVFLGCSSPPTTEKQYRDEYEAFVDRVNFNYIKDDGGDIELDTIGRPKISSLLKQLDKYSTAVRGKNIKSYTAGIGLDISRIHDSVFINDVNPYSPADKAGLQPYDKIIKVNNTVTAGLEKEQILQLLSGEKGTTVTLKILREKDIIDSVTVVREIGNGLDVRHCIIDSINTGYISIRQINTYSDVLKIGRSIYLLSQRQIDYLLLDLRKNYGGDYEEAIECAKLFSPNKTLVATMKQNSKIRSKNYYSSLDTSWYYIYKDKLFILVDEQTDKGAELFADIVRKLCNATIIGKRTAGNNSLQGLIFVSPTLYANVTTAYFYSLGDTSRVFRGILPDHIVDDTNALTIYSHPKQYIETQACDFYLQDLYLEKAAQLIKNGMK